MENNNKGAASESSSTQQQPGLQNASATENKSTCGTLVDPSHNQFIDDEEIIETQFSHPRVEDEEVIETAIKEPTEEERDEKQNNARDAMNDDNYILPGDEEDDGKLD